MASQSLKHDNYTVGWVCALPKEMTAARAMLDEIHPSLSPSPSDHNIYTLGRIGDHNVVIACLPKGEIGNNSAATVASGMSSAFPSIRFGLMVGIGGGAPSKTHDIRLGDVVVSTPTSQHGGVVQWDFGKTTKGGHFERTSTLNRPPAVLTTALSILESTHDLEESRIPKYLEEMITKYPKLSLKYTRPASISDILFEADYEHVDTHDTCDSCDRSKIVSRTVRDDVAIHYGLVASGNQVIKDGVKRDEISRDLGSVLCFEMEAAGLMNRFPCVVIRGICDYADSHKNKKWQEYAAATAAAFAKELLTTIPLSQVVDARTVGEVVSKAVSQAFSEAAQSVIEAQKIQHQAKEELKCLRVFCTSKYEDYKARNQDRVPGTCEWFLKHSKFLDWQDSKTSSLLWVSADPGCGKSILSKSLVDKELISTKSCTTCYFFFKDDDVDQKSVTNALCALLHQLFSQKKNLLKHALPAFENNGTKLPQLFTNLWDILIQAAADPEAGNIICVLDALDECEELGRYKLIDTLVHFYRDLANNKRRNTVLKFLVTSRPYYDIERRFEELTSNIPTIRLAGEEETESISREINLVISAKVEKLGIQLKLDNSVQSSLEKALLNIEHRTYLWLKLIFEMIYPLLGMTEKKLLKTIGTLPNTVGEAYEAILKRSPDKLRTRKLLHIVVGAVRPLTLREMNVALSMEEGSKSYKDLDLEPEESFRTTIRNLCGLFVSVIDSKIYLIHQTAKEFLICKNAAVQPTSYGDSSLEFWKHSLEPKVSSFVLAEICVTYLLFTIFESHPPVINPEDQGSFIQETVVQYTNEHDFLDYAAKHWANHFREAKIREHTTLLKSTLDVCNTQSMRFLTWFQIYWSTLAYGSQCPQGFTDLMVGSFLGHEAVVRLLLEAKADVEAKGSDGTTALHWAAMRRHEAVVRLLLEAKADVEAKGSSGKTALYWAAVYGHEAVVRLLLEAKADVEAKGSDGTTALHRAARSGHEAVVRLLLEAKADVETKDSNGKTALYWAAMNGHEAVGRLLLETKADVEAKDNDGMTALHRAARSGHEAVVRLLLEAKADVEAKDSDGMTALYWAAMRGHEAVVRLLKSTAYELNTSRPAHHLKV